MPLLPRTETFESIIEDNNTRIENLRTLIYELEVTISQIIQTGISSYEFESGQSRQKVTKADLKALQSLRKDYVYELELRLDIKTGRNVVTVIPDF